MHSGSLTNSPYRITLVTSRHLTVQLPRLPCCAHHRNQTLVLFTTTNDCVPSFVYISFYLPDFILSLIGNKPLSYNVFWTPFLSPMFSSQILPTPCFLPLSLERSSRKMFCMEEGWILTEGIADLAKQRTDFQHHRQPGLETDQEERGVTKTGSSVLQETAVERILTKQHWSECLASSGHLCNMATGGLRNHMSCGHVVHSNKTQSRPLCF